MFSSKRKRASEWKDCIEFFLYVLLLITSLDAEKNGVVSFNDALERMERIDREYEKAYQDQILKTSKFDF